MSEALLFAAAALAVLALAEAAPALAAPIRRHSGELAGALEALLRLGREGREPGALERRRLLIVGALVAFCGGSLLIGPVAGASVAVGAPAAVARALRARRDAYRRAVGNSAPGIALAVADALSGGHSLRGALLEASAGLHGPGGAELERVAAELGAGASTEAALERFRDRIGSPQVDSVVAACLVHRRSGGDLGQLLRQLAHGFEDQRRLENEVRVATAQARFTGLLVVLLPLGGALLAELARPGFFAGLARSPLSAWLVGSAFFLQALAAVLIRRFGGPRV